MRKHKLNTIEGIKGELFNVPSGTRVNGSGSPVNGSPVVVIIDFSSPVAMNLGKRSLSLDLKMIPFKSSVNLETSFVERRSPCFVDIAALF